MIPPSMSRPAKVLLILSAAIVVTALTTACGTENISVPPDNPEPRRRRSVQPALLGLPHALVRRDPRVGGESAHRAGRSTGRTSTFAASGRSTRVLYAIQNGGFSGAIMPQNVVVGQQAIDVAKFVATYAGRQAPKIPGATSCVPAGDRHAPGHRADRHDGEHGAGDGRRQGDRGLRQGQAQARSVLVLPTPAIPSD